MTQTPNQQPRDENQQDGDQQNQQRVVVVTQDGMGVAPHSDDEDGPTNPADLVEQPAKVMRIGSMIKQLLEEVRNAPLDEAGRTRLAEIHRRSIKELEDGLAPELIDELERIALPFNEDDAPTDAELRIAQAQLVGWLEGLFHGIQTALFAQQMAAQQQLQQMRRALPPGHPAAGGEGGPGMPGGPGLRPDEHPAGPTGQYL
jgi:Bacterial proteasome activator